MPPPYPPAVDEITEPGLGLLAVKAERDRALAEAARYRRERDEARALARGSLPPGRGRTAKAAILTGQLAVLTPVILVAARIVARRWPETAELVDAIIAALF
jgi:hypothetical protein